MAVLLKNSKETSVVGAECGKGKVVGARADPAGRCRPGKHLGFYT